MTKIAIAMLLLVLCAVPTAAQAPAENTPDFIIYFRGYATAINGPETESGVTYHARPVIGKTVTGTMSTKGCGYFAASSTNEALTGADVGWRLEVTPIRVVDRAVTFRLRWTRAVDRLSRGAAAPPGGDVELTLKVGESRPLDEVLVSATEKTFDGKSCDKSLATLRVGVEPYPQEQFERRLIAMDVWLVERPTDGNERTQLVPLRSLPNRSTSFYFESIRAGEASLDIFGHVLTKLEGDALELAIETISRWDAKPLAYPYRWLRSTVRLLPNEVIEVPLPKLGKDAGPFANHVLSLRIRARRIR